MISNWFILFFPVGAPNKIFK